MTRNAICSAFALLFFIAPLFAFPKNSLLSTISDTSWLRIGDYNCGRASCDQTLDYSGMVYDFHRHKILLFGGGHATAMWNQTEEFDLATLTWKQLNIPDSCTFYLDSTRAYFGDTVMTDTGRVVWPAGGTIGYDGDKRPISRHTYDQLDMAADTCLLIMSATQCDKGGCMSPSQWTNWEYFHDRYVWVFDPVRVSWTRLSPDAVPANFAVGTALDPSTGLLYMAGGRNYDVHTYDWKTRKREIVASCPVGWASCQAMTYNPVNHSMLLFAAANIYEYDITAKTWTAKNPRGTHVNSYLRAVSFDSVNQVFGVINNGAFSYYSPWTNTWYSLPFDTSRFPVNPAFNCTVYDPVNNVYVLLTYGTGSIRYKGWTTWTYKFSDTPGLFPGTRPVLNASERGITAGPLLTISVTPNPFKTDVSLYCPIGSGEVVIYSVDGKAVWSSAITSDKREVLWNPGVTASGLYIAVYSVVGKGSVSKPLYLMK
ncbi:MAG: T9SS type A sorting domain-containing protein [Fibrobacteres bacterium]|nr:T9SS type A sorting domain-containing protein [Fibrobacterota bacterium]